MSVVCWCMKPPEDCITEEECRLAGIINEMEDDHIVLENKYMMLQLEFLELKLSNNILRNRLSFGQLEDCIEQFNNKVKNSKGRGDYFDFLIESSDIVAKWPDWKKNAMGRRSRDKASKSKGEGK